VAAQKLSAYAPSLPAGVAHLWPDAVDALKEPLNVPAVASAPPENPYSYPKHPTLGPDPNLVLQATLTPPARSSRKRAPTPLAAAPPMVRRRSTETTSLSPVPPPEIIDNYSLRADRLGTLVRGLSLAFEAAPSWAEFVREFRGRSYLAEELDHLEHPAAPLLRHWRDEGVPVLSSSGPWTHADKDSYVERGCHRSATEHAPFLREELAEFIDNRFWTVLPYRLVRDLPQLQPSPAAVKEERERKPRLLCDHSWNPVNEDTLPHAPPEALQFGGTLNRLLRDIRHADPAYGPVHLSKYDIKDGYYRMFLRANDCPRLAIIMPRYEGEEQLIAIPMACTMGWVQSPATFCTMSETIADLTNAREGAKLKPVPHRLEELAAVQDCIQTEARMAPRDVEDWPANAALRALAGLTDSPEPEVARPAPDSNCMLKKAVRSTDVFVDDFIQAGQGDVQQLTDLRRQLLHCVDEVLARPLPDESRNEAVSLKKLLKGDGSWGTRKLILGWIVDTVRQTIELPPHRKQLLHDIFTELRGARRVSAKRWRSILGQLRFVSVAIPGSRGLFSALQWAQNSADGNRVRLNRFVRGNIDAFARLAASLCDRPTHLAELVAQQPLALGATDAAKAGMGGVFFTPTGECCYWRTPFPDDVQTELVSAQNLAGRITNSDLEQAAMLAQLDILANHLDVTYATLETLCDNTPAVSRAWKGAVSNPGPAAYLCQVASDHQRLHRYHHRAAYLPGPQNVMADDCSRLQQLTDCAFHAHMQQAYPQETPWRMLSLRPAMNSSLIAALRSSSPPPPSCQKPGGEMLSSGQSGPSTAPVTARLPTCKTSPPRSSASVLSLCLDGAAGIPAQERPANLSELTQWRQPSKLSERGSPNWASTIHGSRRRDPKSTIPYYMISWKPSANKTTPANGRIRPTSPSSPTWQPSRKDPSASATRPSTAWPSSVSSGCCAPPSTWTGPAKPGPSPSASVTSASKSTARPFPPLTHL
jgi:hypothetical protein